MSRFKKLNRIEDAIKHRNRSELEWALEYAQDRFNTSTMKQHEKGMAIHRQKHQRSSGCTNVSEGR
jgi:hypothetical protein